ncbi:MAG TPA: hypothetical protein VIV60_01200 [Polyangiaceae bacterium]
MRVQRPALAKRYAIHLPLDLGDVTARFVGTDTSTGQTVVVAFVEPQLRDLLHQGVGSLHRHLAGLLAVVEDPNADALPIGDEKPPSGAAIVAELIRGPTLHDQMNGVALPSDRAVAWMMRILDGLLALHQRGVPHGALSSHSVIAEPKGRPIAPVLSQLVVPALKSYVSPERLTGAGPGIADDLWAAGLLLFEMLTGRLPVRPEATFGSVRELAESETQPIRSMAHGRDLEVIVKRLLSPDRSRRPATVEELIDMLDRWEQRIALAVTVARAPLRSVARSKSAQLAPWDRVVSELEGGARRLAATLDAAEQMRQSMLSEHSHSVGPSERPTAFGKSNAHNTSSQRPSGPNFEEVRRRAPSFGPEMAAFRERSKPKLGKWWIAVVGILGTLGLAVAFIGTREDKERLSTSASAHSVDAPPVAPGATQPERPRLPLSEERSQCIRSYFRPDTIVDNVNLAFVCTEEDFLVVNRKLNDEAFATLLPAAPNAAGASGVQARSGTPSVATNPAMVIRSPNGSTKGWQLGWYELVANAIIRQNCCREAAPIKLPESTGWCQQLQSVVRRIAADSVKVGDISPGVRVFDEAISCLMAQGRHVVYPYKSAPTSLQRSNFQQFLKHVAEVDARRSRR